eukprot:g2624.t1
MSLSVSRKESLVLRLHELNAVKFGQFKLKSGLISPFYFDLRVVVSCPEVLTQVADTLWEVALDANFDLLCGVPYTALPFATVMSIQHGVPLLMRRKEVKDYGTKKAIEGVFQPGQKVLIVEDLVTSGSSVLETVRPLEGEGLVIQDAVVLLDREQGAEERLKSSGIRLHAAFSVSFLLDVLLRNQLVSHEDVQNVQKFLKENQTTTNKTKNKRLSYKTRAKLAKCELGRRCFEIMERKETNLAVAADVTSTDELLALAEILGPHICILKTHVDILNKWSTEIGQKLRQIAEKYDFLIFEDRKFADIGNTVIEQYCGGIYKISDWSDITNAHLLPGPGIIDGLASVGLSRSKGLLLLAEMSSQGTLCTGDYTQSVIEEALKHPEFVMGFISISPADWPPQDEKESFSGLIQMTPGVALSQKGDDLGQQYNTPDSVIKNRGSDVIIVGRGIIKSKDPKTAAIDYKTAGWNAYLESLK